VEKRGNSQPIGIDRRQIIDMQLPQRFAQLLSHSLAQMTSEPIRLVLEPPGNKVESEGEGLVDGSHDELGEKEGDDQGRVDGAGEG